MNNDVITSFKIMPFHFWSAVFFLFGSIVGSFLNVCIHRLPRSESLFWPPSHCPKCGTHIPWYYNIPIFSWISLKGRCGFCHEPISPRYVIVEAITAFAFLACWLRFGKESWVLALIFSGLISMFIVASFIDFEHMIIPDELTIGGIITGFLVSLAFPELHHTQYRPLALQTSAIGILVGLGSIFAMLKFGKLLFGRQRIVPEPGEKVIFGENSVMVGDKSFPYEEIFFRTTDIINIQALTVKVGEQTWENVKVQVSPEKITIGDKEFNPESINSMEITTSEIIIPREAMGLGDVKFMGAIGAYLGWKAVLFSLMLSSFIGAITGLTLIILKKKEWSSRIPYGPYIATAAVVWIFAGQRILDYLFRGI